MRDFPLGEIVNRMKVATKEEVEAALAEQRRMSDDDMLGELLVSRGVISRAQLNLALEVQRGLRSKSKATRALAMAKLSQASGARIMEMASALRSSSRETKRSATGSGYPAVTALLATKT